MDAAGSQLVGFKRHLRVETVPAEAVYLISERGVTVLSGSFAERLAPLLDGTRSIAQLTREVSAELAGAEVTSLLEPMSDAGLIDFRPPDPGAAVTADAAAAAFWALTGLDADAAARSIGAATVEIVAIGGTDAAAAAAACAESGLACCEQGTEGATVSVVLCEDYLDPRLRAVNARHLASGRPWLLAKPTGAEAWIGPMFRPGAGPCWTCLATRLEGSRDEAHLLRRVLGTRAFPAAPQASLPASRTAALHLAALEVAKWLAGLRDEGQQAIYILDMLSLNGRHHTVHRRPQCACCGTPGMTTAQAYLPPVITRAMTGPTGSGRQAGPEQVLKDYGHLVDPVTGIVAELRRDERCPDFQYAFVSGRNRALAASTLASLRVGSLSPSGGRGVIEQEAKAGALGEAIERYCGTRQGGEPTVRGSLASFGAQAVHPNACLLFDQRQFDDRARWNAACAPFHRVPEPFDDAAAIDWTPVWSLLTGKQRLLPTAMLYYHPRAERRPACVWADSNGNAAGVSLEDAIIRGFLELVERDAIALWWYNRTRQPGVCLRSFEDPWIAGLPEMYGRLRREVWVLDTTSDLGIPVMAAISRRTGDATEDIMYGFGAHFDPRIALRRALTELGQLLPSAAVARTGRYRYGAEGPHLASWWTGATVANQSYLLPQPGRSPRTAADYGDTARACPDLDGICTVARRAGLDMLVLDQTRPDVRMPVVKVVVPGMRHFWPRFAPGRIFDVPFRLGRVTRPAEYSELNPIPVYVLLAQIESSPMRADDERTVSAQKLSERWSLREDVTVEMEPGDGPLRLRGRWGEVIVERPSRLVRDALARMRLGPISLENAISGREAVGTPAAQRAELYRVLDRLQSLIIRSLSLESGQPLLSVVPITVGSRFHPVPLAADIPIRLSAYAALRTDGNTYRLESPLALHRVLLHRAEAVMLITSLASPVTPAAVVASLPPIGQVTADALEYLTAAGMVVQAEEPAENPPVFAEDTDSAISGWSPTDLMFHASSTLGRHDHNFGVTYPTGETAPAEPAVKPQANEYIQLHRPRWEELCEADPPLTAAIEGRRSMRRHGARPITITELGDLLYRTARVRSLVTLEPQHHEVPGSPEVGYELSDRPYPSGGACYELEFYTTAGNCAGLVPGVYHYDPLGHRLEPVSEDREAVDELLACARVAAAMDDPPQVLISMTARFRRLSWKYEALAYRLVLMHVGVLTQNLYLVSTAMRLAACALGSVSIAAAARAFGTDWRVEPCVGQFILGREPDASGRDTSPWRKINDAEWADFARTALR